jgi:outer membrane lipoprotein-sorting protein
MRRLVPTVLALGLSCLLALAGWAGEDEAAALIDKAIKAHFPKGVDKKNDAVRTKSKGKLHVMGLELEYTSEVAVQSPDKFKEVMELNVMNNRILVTTVFDGKKGWIRAGDKDVPVTDEILDELKEAAYSIDLMQGLFSKDKKVILALVGEVKVKDKPALAVRISREGKKDFTLCIDKTTHLMTKVEVRKRDLMSGQEVTEERFITEYQDVGDRKVAKKIEILRDGKAFLDAEVTDVQIFPKLDDSEFAKPQ